MVEQDETRAALDGEHSLLVVLLRQTQQDAEHRVKEAKLDAERRVKEIKADAEKRVKEIKEVANQRIRDAEKRVEEANIRAKEANIRAKEAEARTGRAYRRLCDFGKFAIGKATKPLENSISRLQSVKNRQRRYQERHF